MASLANAFALLEAEEQANVVPAPKKKSKKKKKDQQATETASSAAAPLVPDAGAEEGAGEFQPAGRRHTVKDRSQQPDKAEADGGARQQSLKDACSDLERSAALAKGDERSALVLEWTQRAQGSDWEGGSAGLTFKQLLLKCQALDRLLEGYLAGGCGLEEAGALGSLLSSIAHESLPAGCAHAVAATVASLGELLARDPLLPTADAKRSIAAALALLRAGVPAPAATAAGGPTAQLASLSGELAAQEGRLHSTPPKELPKLYSGIHTVLCQQLDILRSSTGDSTPAELAAALKPLQELRAMLAARLKEALAPPKPALTVEQRVAQAKRGFLEEDTAMQSKLAEAEARVASLEAELAAARSAAADLRQQLEGATEHQERVLAQIRSGAAASEATAAEVAAALQGSLGAVDSLSGALQTAGASTRGPAVDAAALGEELAGGEVPVKLMGAMQQVVELGLQTLGELATKAAFYRERVAQAAKQGEHMARLGLGDAKSLESSRRNKEALERTLKELLTSAEATSQGVQAAVGAYRERLPTMLRLPSFLPPPPDYLPSMDVRAAEAAQLCEGILAGASPPKPAARPAAPVEEGAQGSAADTVAATVASSAVAGSLGQPSNLKKRLAQLEVENRKKDEQIAALLNSSTTLDIPSPLANGHAAGPVDALDAGAPSAPPPATLPPAPLPEADLLEGGVLATPVAPEVAAAGSGRPPPSLATPVVSFSQALLGGGPRSRRV